VTNTVVVYRSRSEQLLDNLIQDNPGLMLIGIGLIVAMIVIKLVMDYVKNRRRYGGW
jgi:hypothetical protein